MGVVRHLKILVVLPVCFLLAGCWYLGCKTEEEIQCPKSKDGYVITLTPESCSISDGPEAYSSYRPDLKFPFQSYPQCATGMAEGDARITHLRFKVSANDMKPSRSIFSASGDDEIYVLLEPRCKSKKVEKPFNEQLQDRFDNSLLSKDVKGTVLYDSPVRISDKILFLKYNGYIDIKPHYPVGDFYYSSDEGKLFLTSTCDDKNCRASFVTDDGYYSIFIIANSVDPKNMPEIKDKIEALVKSFYVPDSIQVTGSH